MHAKNLLHPASYLSPLSRLLVPLSVAAQVSQTGDLLGVMAFTLGALQLTVDKLLALLRLANLVG
jgi:hypothetical protein